jgi:hypothetical protein
MVSAIHISIPNEARLILHALHQGPAGEGVSGPAILDTNSSKTTMTQALKHANWYAADLLIILIILGNTLVFSCSLTPSAPVVNSLGDVLVRDDNLLPAHLIFACDGPTSSLKTLFTPELVGDLRQLNAGIAFSTEDFSSERAEVVRQLNAAGIPTVAVIVLDDAHGYYVSAEDAAATADRFAEFDRWTSENGLRWEAIGLDIEPSRKDWTVINGQRLRFFGMILGRVFESNNRVYDNRRMYADLIRRMQSRGYFVQTYQLPLIANERRAHSTLLEKVLGLVDVQGNQEVLMLYTSFNQKAGAAIIWQYGPQTKAIAIGSTAGSAIANGKFSPLSWDEFSRDLIVAHHFSRTVGVYSLEGCISRGYISRLQTMDWNRPVQIPAASIRRAERFQKVIDCVLWASRFWLYFAVLFLLLFAWAVKLTVHRMRKRRALPRTASS